MSQPLISIKQVVLIALVVALLGTGVTLLVAHGVSVWILLPVILFLLVGGALLYFRDPDRQRRWLVRRKLST